MTSSTMHDCVGALLVRDGRVLLGRRAQDRAWLPGAWDLFGGHVEPGESPEAALRRELAEELGLVPRDVRELALLHAPDGSWRLRIFAVSRWRGAPENRQPREHDAIAWLTRDEAVERLHGAHPDFVRVLDAALAVTQAGQP